MRTLLLVLALGTVSACSSKPVCSPSSCASGCCDSSGVCQSGIAATACGIGGASCRLCSLGETCQQGLCAGSIGVGGGSSGVGGGSSGVGGGTSGVGGGASGVVGGGASGTGLEIVPPSATLPEFGSVLLSGRVINGTDTGIRYELESGSGSLSAYSQSQAQFFANSSPGSVVVRATSRSNSAVSQLITLTLVPTATSFAVVPQFGSGDALPDGSRQTFAGARSSNVGPSPSSNASLVGVVDLQWLAWPGGSFDSSGTLSVSSATQLVYAREPSTNVWASAEVRRSAAGPTPAIVVTPSVSTTTTGGVVQLTATTSSGGAVQWAVVSTNGGSVNSSGTYTAPSRTGVFLVQASSGRGQAFATIVVR